MAKRGALAARLQLLLIAALGVATLPQQLWAGSEQQQQQEQHTGAARQRPTFSGAHLRTLAANGPEPHAVIMTLASCAFKLMAVNFYQQLEKFGRHGQVLMIAQDKCVHEFLREEIGSLHVVPAMPTWQDNQWDTSGNFGSQEFNVMVKAKMYHMLHVLELGVPLLFQDLDSVFLRDPFHFMPMGGYDAVLMHDGIMPFPQHQSFQACSCLMLLMPTWGSIRLMRRWLAKAEEDGANPGTHDQMYLQRLLEDFEKKDDRLAHNLRLLMLPSNLFPSGTIFERMTGNQRKAVVWVHANWRQGDASKLRFLRSAAAWLVAEPPDPPSPPPPPPSPPRPPPPS